MRHWRSFCLLAIVLFVPTNIWADEPKAAAKPTASEPDAANKPRRRVYVLHSGLHTILSDPVKNIAAETLKEGLLKRGVAERDLIVMENPFPYASWKSLLPFESLTMFFDSIEPSSKMSHDAYQRMHKALRAQGVGRRDAVVWVGHSAGGQIGLTMANLARNLWKYPGLARDTSPYHFEMVITLGTPINSEHLPPDVKLRHYYSPEDKVVRWATKIGPWLAYPLGYRLSLKKVPAPPWGELPHSLLRRRRAPQLGRGPARPRAHLGRGQRRLPSRLAFRAYSGKVGAVSK